MNPVIWDIVSHIISGTVGALLTFIIMLIRERNNFATRVMNLFLEDKKTWGDERRQLESRVDYLTEQLDKVKEELWRRESPH